MMNRYKSVMLLPAMILSVSMLTVAEAKSGSGRDGDDECRGGGIVTPGTFTPGTVPGSGGGIDRTRMRCGAEGAGDISMDARFETRNGREKFDASFEADPNGVFQVGDVLEVFVDGVNVGNMTLIPQANGDIGGDLEFDTNIEGPFDNDVPFPANFPVVGSGSSVVVDTLGCVLRN